MHKLLLLLLPVLFPSWRFFGEVGPSPRIEYRLDREVNWRPVFEPPAHVDPMEMLRRLFWNSDWNERLFLSSCAERLCEEPSEVLANEMNQRIARRVPEAKGALQFRVFFVIEAARTEVEFESTPFSLRDLLA